MATYTENFDLIKPDDEDYYDVADFNANMDIIDAELGAVAESANSTEVADKIGQPADTVLNTVFGKMNGFISPDGKGVRIIKSIQRLSIGVGSNRRTSITPVVPERCIVLSERLANTDTYLHSYNYTLEANALVTNITDRCTIGFWIIEFY